MQLLALMLLFYMRYCNHQIFVKHLVRLHAHEHPGNTQVSKVSGEQFSVVNVKITSWFQKPGYCSHHVYKDLYNQVSLP